MKNGQHLGFNKGWYAASKPSRKAQISRFKFCKDEACVRDVGNDINPGDPIRLMVYTAKPTRAKIPTNG